MSHRVSKSRHAGIVAAVSVSIPDLSAGVTGHKQAQVLPLLTPKQAAPFCFFVAAPFFQFFQVPHGLFT